MTDSEKKWWDGDKKLRTTGELVSGGGLSGGVMSVLYLIIGMAFGDWSALELTGSSIPGGLYGLVF